MQKELEKSFETATFYHFDEKEKRNIAMVKKMINEWQNKINIQKDNKNKISADYHQKNFSPKTYANRKIKIKINKFSLKELLDHLERSKSSTDNKTHNKNIEKESKEDESKIIIKAQYNKNCQCTII